MKKLIFVGLVFAILSATLVDVIGYYSGFAVAVQVFAWALIPVLAILFFSRTEVIKSWTTLFLFWVALSLFAIIVTPEFGSIGGFGLDLAPDRKDIAWLMAGLFFILSLILIAWKSWRLRGK